MFAVSTGEDPRQVPVLRNELAPLEFDNAPASTRAQLSSADGGGRCAMLLLRQTAARSRQGFNCYCSSLIRPLLSRMTGTSVFDRLERLNFPGTIFPDLRIACGFEPG
jgi:hypothetical protein